MGHVLNPISQRLGMSRFWNANWAVLNKPQYSYLAVQNTQLHKYLSVFFGRVMRRLFRRGTLLVNIKSIRVFNRLFLVLYFKLKSISYLYYLFTELCYFQKERRRWRRRRRLLLLKKAKRNRTRLFLIKNKKQPLIKKELFVKKQPLIKRKFLTKRELRFFDKTKYKLKKYNFKILKYLLNKDALLSDDQPFKIMNSKFVYKSGRELPYSPHVSTGDSNALFWHNASMLRLSLLKAKFSLRRHTVIRRLFRVFLLRSWVEPIQNIISTILKNLLLSKAVNPEVLLVFYPVTCITAGFIAQYIGVRLLQRFPVRQVVNSVLKQLKKLHLYGAIIGFKIECNGRFARRGRASHIWKNRGTATRTNVNLDLDYAIYLPVLINSVCAVKVWITRVHQPTKLLIV